MPDPNWSLDVYRIEYRKLREGFWDLVQRYQCTRLIVGEGMRCAMDKGHAEKCGQVARFASPGPHRVIVQPDPTPCYMCGGSGEIDSHDEADAVLGGTGEKPCPACKENPDA